MSFTLFVAITCMITITYSVIIFIYMNLKLNSYLKKQFSIEVYNRFNKKIQVSKVAKIRTIFFILIPFFNMILVSLTLSNYEKQKDVAVNKIRKELFMLKSE